jgi:HAMP domain-containing protein
MVEGDRWDLGAVVALLGVAVTIAALLVAVVPFESWDRRERCPSPILELLRSDKASTPSPTLQGQPAPHRGEAPRQIHDAHIAADCEWGSLVRTTGAGLGTIAGWMMTSFALLCSRRRWSPWTGKAFKATGFTAAAGSTLAAGMFGLVMLANPYNDLEAGYATMLFFIFGLGAIALWSLLVKVNRTMRRRA